MSLTGYNSLSKSIKHCGNRKKCWLAAFSPVLTMFSKALISRFVKTRDCMIQVKCGLHDLTTVSGKMDFFLTRLPPYGIESIRHTFSRKNLERDSSAMNLGYIKFNGPIQGCSDHNTQ